MIKSILFLLMIIPVVAGAQKESFLKEFNQVNDWFFRQNKIILDQKYYYYDKSDKSPVLDSALCRIVRDGTSLHYLFNTVELFSDSGYIIRLNHESRNIIVNKTPRTDTTTIKMLLSEGLSNFTGFTKTIHANNQSCWELTGGIAGVSSAILTMDVMNHQIEDLIMVLDENNPLVNVYGKPNPDGLRKIIIKIVYHYSSDVDQADLVHLSDFVKIENELISAAPKYDYYNINIINQAP